MFLHHKYGLHLDSFIIFSSSSAIRRCNFGTNNSPSILLKCLSSQCKYVIFNTTSTKSIMVSVEKYFSFRLLSHFLNADRPSSCDMFGYNPTTSIVHKIIPSGNFGRERSFFRNLLVSLL